MKTRLLPLFCGLSLLFLAGCGCHSTSLHCAAPESAPEAAPAGETLAATESALRQNIEGAGLFRKGDGALPQETFFANLVLLKSAWTAVGTPYVRGGTTPAGFDCSGFVQWTYRHIGVNLPRTAREQSVVGEPVKKREEMRAGDIVAFRHPRRGYHTGIYIGDGKFIHSPRTRSVVKVSSLEDGYFKQTFLGARRIDPDGDLEAQLAAAAQLPPQVSVKAAPAKAKKAAKKAAVKTGAKSALAAKKGQKAVKTARKAQPKARRVAALGRKK